MSKCGFCDFKVVEECDDEYGDYCEGQAMLSDLGNEMTMVLSKLERGSGASIYVKVDAEWTDRIDYRFGDVHGTLDHRTEYDNGGIFEVRFCPMCGKEL